MRNEPQYKEHGYEKNILHILTNLSLKDRITRGKYGWVNSDITEEHFPVDIPADYEAEYELFNFSRSFGSEAAIAEMDKDGFRPATLAELLVLGETQPELQKQFPIIALGSLWLHSPGYRVVPVLYLHDGKRELLLDWFEHDWNDDYRFLAVRK